MKIALCLSGQPRGLPLSLRFLKYGLDVDNMDVFFHAWFDPETIGQPYDSAQSSQLNKVGIVHPDTEKLLIDNLEPIDFVIEGQKEFAFADKFHSLPNAKQGTMASIFYSIYMANQLKIKHEQENNFKYDLVIRTRYDLIYKKPINVSDYYDFKDKIITSTKFQAIRNNPNFPNGDYTLTDIFAFSSSENMDIFCDVFPNMEEINKNIKNVPYGENYLGYRVRVMGELDTHCVNEFDYEIMHRLIDVNNIEQLEKMYA